MKKILLVSSFFPLTIFTLILSILLLLTESDTNVKATKSQNILSDVSPKASGSSKEKVGAVRQFLARHHSPLQDYASYIVEVSDTYSIDYRLIPAIAMQETNLCKKTPSDSYNCWGYGVYGGKVTYFSNYKEGIERVAFTLSQSYIKKGYTTIEQIMSKYTPRNTNNWVYAVTHFMSQIE